MGLLLRPLELLFPSLCVLCTSQLEGEQVVCGRCLEGLPETGLGCWVTDTSVHEGLDGVWSAFWYDEQVQRLIHLLKYEGYRRLGRRLGEAAYRLLVDEIPWSQFDMLAPIPLHRTKKRERGYNQSAVLARAVGGVSSVRVDAGLVVRHRWTQSQTGLSIEERCENVLGSFRSTRPGGGKNVLLIDDVLSTGATASACAQALKSNGYGEVAVLTIATPQKGG
ncbi:MAG: ComF family protein [Fidelibacterota bacterium]|nr:MAG: ComF family protein [Candidatus Neomarinimicrobiota bacterium]